MSSRATITLLPRGRRRVLATVGACIYCGKTEDLSEEHIIPLALGGIDVLDEASCAGCAAVTSAVELRIARSSALWPLRRALDLPSRRRRQQPTEFRAREIVGDSKRDVMIPIQRYPLAVPFFVFARPTFWTGEAPSIATAGQILIWVPKPLSNATPLELDADLDVHDVARLLAKIGLGYAVADHGLARLREVFLRDLILGRSNQGNAFVGTLTNGYRFASNRLHAATVAVDNSIVSTFVQLFRPPHLHKPTPVYEIVVGRACE